MVMLRGGGGATRRWGVGGTWTKEQRGAESGGEADKQASGSVSADAAMHMAVRVDGEST